MKNDQTLSPGRIFAPSSSMKLQRRRPVESVEKVEVFFEIRIINYNIKGFEQVEQNNFVFLGKPLVQQFVENDEVFRTSVLETDHRFERIIWTPSVENTTFEAVRT